MCGVRAAAGRARKAARSDCASGATSAGVTLGGSGAAVRARLGGGTSAMTKAPEHEMGQCITRLAPGGGPDAPGQRTVVAACCGCCDGNELCAFGCGWQGVRLPLKWGPRCCGRAAGRSLTRVEDSSGRRRTMKRPATCLGICLLVCYPASGCRLALALALRLADTRSRSAHFIALQCIATQRTAVCATCFAPECVEDRNGWTRRWPPAARSGR